MGWFVGLDWGSEEHALCVVDDAGKVIMEFAVAHAAEELLDLRNRLAKLGSPGEIKVAIERPTGLVVDSLVDAGYVVVPIHPNVVKACRPRYRAAGGKDDRGDAYLLADVLRTDGHRFRPLSPQSDSLKALRALVRTRDDLVTARVAMANQLRALLQSFWPGASAIFANIDSPIALAFVQRYPTPESAPTLDEKKLTSFLRKHRYSGRKPTGELLGRLRAAPRGLAGEAETRANGVLVGTLARVLEQLVIEIAAVTARIEQDVVAHADGAIVMSFPRSGRVNAAQILVELGDVRERFVSEEQLAAEAGVTPVTHASGKSRGVAYRWACNQRLRKALTFWAGNSRLASPWAADVYKRARARGCRHPHAVRILARAWLRVLWRTWHSRTVYDPTKHTAARRFSEAA